MIVRIAGIVDIENERDANEALALDDYDTLMELMPTKWIEVEYEDETAATEMV